MPVSQALDRRTFLKLFGTAAVVSSVHPFLSYASPLRSRVVRIHDSQATRPWDYAVMDPWNHTVENHGEFKEVTHERYYDYIDADVVQSMLDRGLRELTDMSSAKDAWRSLLPGVSQKDRIAIKMNMNNASGDPAATTNRMDQTMPLANAILNDLVNVLEVPEEQITMLDASRWFHPLIMKGRSRFPNVRWVDNTDKDRWDPSESVEFKKSEPLPGGKFWMPRDYTQADHIINLCLMKNHGCGITGAMKSHFGSIPSPKMLHEGLGDKGYIADVCNTPSIREKVRINIADATFANWHNNVWCPRPWKTFPEQSPNSLLMSADPVALDSVMLDHIIAELEMQGDAAPRWVREGVTHTAFLDYAMKGLQLGVHEHAPYRRIDYLEVEA